MAPLANPLSTQLAPQPTYLNPYGSTVIQYPYNPYGIQPSYVQQSMLGPIVHPVGGYITLPGVQPVLQQPAALQPIYYNSGIAAPYGQIAVTQAQTLGTIPPSSQPSAQPAFLAPQPYAPQAVQTTQATAYPHQIFNYQEASSCHLSHREMQPRKAVGHIRTQVNQQEQEHPLIQTSPQSSYPRFPRNQYYSQPFPLSLPLLSLHQERLQEFNQHLIL